MALTPATIKPSKGAKKTNKRLGRGNASGKGTYSARGLKGQRSRSGGKSGNQLRGFKSSLQKVPKLRGFKSITPKKQTVTLFTLDRIATEKDVVSPAFLEKKGIIKKAGVGVKIVATGEITKKLQIKDCLLSKGALEKIEKAGGKVQF